LKKHHLVCTSKLSAEEIGMQWYFHFSKRYDTHSRLASRVAIIRHVGDWASAGRWRLIMRSMAPWPFGIYRPASESPPANIRVLAGGMGGCSGSGGWWWVASKRPSAYSTISYI
jgi:hypothetical protein